MTAESTAAVVVVASEALAARERCRRRYRHLCNLPRSSQIMRADCSKCRCWRPASSQKKEQLRRVSEARRRGIQKRVQGKACVNAVVFHVHSVGRQNFQRGDGGNVKESSKCARSPPAHRQGTVRTSSGAMDEMSRKVQSASMRPRSNILVDVAVIEICLTTTRVNKDTTAL